MNKLHDIHIKDYSKKFPIKEFISVNGVETQFYWRKNELDAYLINSLHELVLFVEDKDREVMFVEIHNEL